MFARLDIPPGGAFWTKPELISATDADIIANDKGTMNQARHREMAFAIRIAAQNLANMEVCGTC